GAKTPPNLIKYQQASRPPPPQSQANSQTEMPPYENGDLLAQAPYPPLPPVDRDQCQTLLPAAQVAPTKHAYGPRGQKCRPHTPHLDLWAIGLALLAAILLRA